MNSTQTHSIPQLPLSWARTSITNPIFNQVKLPFTSTGWIPTADIPHEGEQVAIEGFTFEMLEASSTKVDLVRVYVN